MGLTSRRKRSLDRAHFHRDATLCIVAVEGAETEDIYLAIFRDPASPLFNKRVRVVPLVDRLNHLSSPVALVERLDSYRQENEIQDSDQFWVVADVDHWVQHGQLQMALTAAKQKGYSLAVSNPNFELWLYLHTSANVGPFVGLSMGKQKRQITLALRAFFGAFSKNKFDASKLTGLVDAAIKNAKALDDPPCAAWPNAIGTTVYRLVDWIRDH